jgi:hypothetical protein
MIYRDFLELGFRIFGIYSIDKNGACACGSENCHAPGKHPVASNWQFSPLWSEEQLEVMELTGQLATGYGVLMQGLFVIDVDARNGGVESYAKLVEKIPEISGAGLIVNTGSGGGSKHLYFLLPEPLPLLQSLPEYPGIDFKSTGFCIGAGSLHASGNKYTVAVGSPYDIEQIPAALINALKKPERHRAAMSGTFVDISEQELADMLAAINPDCDHETWYRCGMAVHEVTAGTGFDIWNNWSSLGQKYPGRDTLEKRWFSFGKSTNPVTIGTLKHYAEQAGWRESVIFTDQTEWLPINEANPLDLSGIDLLRPPGFVGDVADWINKQCIFPRENLAVAAALMAVSNCGGMRYEDPLDYSSFNLFCFGVADSSTGKEAILQAHNELLRAAGVAGALVGGIKSEQEIFRNLLRHQAAFYSVDELGEHLSKISNARTKGTTPYLEGVIGQLMSIYSKSNSFVPITGDLKEEVRNALTNERGRLQKAIDENDDATGRVAKRIARIDHALSTINLGIENPFLSIFGVTTPERFDSLMTHDMVANGFMGRALIFRELDGNPRIRPRASRNKEPLPDKIKYALCNLYAPGVYDMAQDDRVERVGDKSPIQTTRDALAALDLVSEHFWEQAEQHKEQTGLHAIPRRGYELTAKISAVLAIPSGLRTIEHVRWAFALIKKDIDGKMRLAYSNSATEKVDALSSRILSLVTHEHGETTGRIIRSCRGYNKADVEKAVAMLIEKGALVEIQSDGRGRPTKKLFAV